MNGLRARGGAPGMKDGNTRFQSPAFVANSSEPAISPTKKARITAFDSMRFFLIAYIVCGHFIRFVDPSVFVLKAFTQINVVVGAFFALSGYVAAYTTTENGKREATKKLLDTPSPKWILSRVFGYYPLYIATLLLFAPVFLYPDVHFSGWPTAIGHCLISATMTQAW
jgi:peptidoglycan/LPS O-acetylase OafA/YrhL